ncbi:MAG: VWD domain-containing protein [Rhodothermales bacterium]
MKRRLSGIDSASSPWQALRLVLGSLLLYSTFLPVDGLMAQSARRNEFGPLDSKCRDACGPDCPDTCDKKEYNECTEDGKSILIVTRYTCGTHQGCRDHDDCLDACLAPYEYKSIPGTDVTYADFEFWGVGSCQRKCHLEAWNYAESEFPGHGPAVVKSWASGGGPYDGPDTWEYTRDKKDGPDRTQPCDECEYCYGGACLPEDDCEPCNSCNDVHLYTLDGLKFDFQAAGEFTLLANVSRTFVLQARQEQLGAGRVSVNTAVAVKVGESRVGVYLPDVLRIDGRTVVLNELGSVELPGGGNVRHRNRAYAITWPNGARVSVKVRRSHLNIGVVLPDEMKGTVRGILGNFDGESGNDMFSAGGEQFAKPLTYEKLYRQYGDTWRIGQEESLFDYDSGKSTATYQLPDFPGHHVRRDDIDKKDRDRAEEICRKAGVVGEAQFDDCVFDVALTGNESFAENNARSKTLVKEVLRIEGEGGPPEAEKPAAPAEASDIVLNPPDELLAGFTVEIAVTGKIKENDFIAIVPPGSPVRELGKVVRVKGESVKLDLPAAAGEYELRYVTAAAPRQMLAHLPVTVLPLQVSLEAPDAVDAGSEIEVVVRGTLNAEDFITIVPAGSAEDILHKRALGRINTGTLGLDLKRTLRLVAPDAAGRYEIRYVTHAQPRKTYATVPIQVN